ncbi:hypothetical protein FM076_18320 [Streptomyces albus subsp. chlorinus]|uniref:hypothetical protein n=1 Tax=Streptomyces albus TaxID=1888 RepID=UPI00156E4687|nr:hypothetical protein [Streptomyces albus]NSC23007.1 hypothetical protein [Streptomyces albus subsp. chlorinus]
MRIRCVPSLLAALVALGAGGVTALPAAAASSAAASPTAEAKAPCKTEHLKRYPGDSTPPRWRYGALDYSVTACPSQDPADWASGATWETNKVGLSNGIFLDSARVQVLQTDEDARTKSATYDGSFVVKSCIPVVEWPCGRTYREHVFFTVTVDKATGAVRTERVSHSMLPPGLSLYTTP